MLGLYQLDWQVIIIMHCIHLNKLLHISSPFTSFSIYCHVFFIYTVQEKIIDATEVLIYRLDRLWGPPNLL
jgi:hypothetical protein